MFASNSGAWTTPSCATGIIRIHNLRETVAALRSERSTRASCRRRRACPPKTIMARLAARPDASLAYARTPTTTRLGSPRSPRHSPASKHVPPRHQASKLARPRSPQSAIKWTLLPRRPPHFHVMLPRPVLEARPKPMTRRREPRSEAPASSPCPQASTPAATPPRPAFLGISLAGRSRLSGAGVSRPEAWQRVFPARLAPRVRSLYARPQNSALA